MKTVYRVTLGVCLLSAHARAFNLPSYAVTRLDTDRKSIRLEFEWSKNAPPNFPPSTTVEFSVNIDPKCFVQPRGGRDDDVRCEGMDTNLVDYQCYKDVWNYWAPGAAEIGNELLARCGSVDWRTRFGIEQLASLGEVVDDNGNFAIGVRDASRLQAGIRYYFEYPVEPSTDPSCDYAGADDGFAWIRMESFNGTCDLPTTTTTEYFRCPELIGFAGTKVFGIQIPGCVNVDAKMSILLNRLCVPTANWLFTPGKDVANPFGATCIDHDNDGLFAIPTVQNDSSTTSRILCETSGQPIPMFGSRVGDCNDCNATVTNVLYKASTASCWCDPLTDGCPTCTPDCAGKCGGSDDGCSGQCNNSCPSTLVCQGGICGSAVESTGCSNSTKDVGEFGVDCGGPCTPCIESCPSGDGAYCGDGQGKRIVGRLYQCTNGEYSETSDCGGLGCVTRNPGLPDDCITCGNGTCDTTKSETCESCAKDCCLSAPTLLSPAEGATFTAGSSLQFAWSSVTNANRYRVKVCRDNVLSDCLTCSGSPSGSCEFPIEQTSGPVQLPNEARSWFWQASALPANEAIGWGERSLSRTFLTTQASNGGSGGTTSASGGSSAAGVGGSGAVSSADCPDEIIDMGLQCDLVIPFSGDTSQYIVPGSKIPSAPVDTVLSIDSTFFSASAEIATGALSVSKLLVSSAPAGNSGVNVYWGSIGSGTKFARVRCPGNDVIECVGAPASVCTGDWQTMASTSTDTNWSCGLGRQTGTTEFDWVVVAHLGMAGTGGANSGGSATMSGGTTSCVDACRPVNTWLCNSSNEEYQCAPGDPCNEKVSLRICYSYQTCIDGKGCTPCGAPTQPCCAPGSVCSPESACVSGICVHCDRDDDGHRDETAICGGDDCDDAHASVYPGKSETCDGLDNDCNGSIDDSLGSQTCGSGPCQNTITACGSGQRPSCQPLPAPSTTEICGNGIDDDCVNGIDNDCGNCATGTTQSCYSGVPTTSQGVGSCKAGTRACDSSGNWPAQCLNQVTPSFELCDAADRDCDGLVDCLDPDCAENTKCACGHTVEVTASCLDHIRTDMPDGQRWDSASPSDGHYRWSCVASDRLMRFQLYSAGEPVNGPWGCGNPRNDATPITTAACVDKIGVTIDGIPVSVRPFIEWYVNSTTSTGACNFLVCTKPSGCELCCNGADDDTDGAVDGFDTDCPVTPDCEWKT